MNPELKLVVFDLDFTLWDCGGTWCDCLSPPFRYEGKKIYDSRSHHVRLYDDVLSILERLEMKGMTMALASRTHEPSWAEELIQMLEISHYFEFKEIYPSSKLRHFRALQNDTGVDYENMLFFDDEMRNIREVGDLGVKCIYLENGLSNKKMQEGLKLFTQ